MRSEAGVHIKHAKIPNELLDYYEKIKSIESKMGIQMRMPYDLEIRF